MPVGAANRSRKIGYQDGTVLDAYQTSRLRGGNCTAVRGAGGSLAAGYWRTQCVEEFSRRCGRIVGSDGVVDDVGIQRVKKGNSSSIPSGHVVGDDVVGENHVIPS